MSDLTAELIAEMWTSMNSGITERNREFVAKEMLVFMEEHGLIDYDILIELRHLNDELKAASEAIYIEDEYEEEDEIDYDIDMDDI